MSESHKSGSETELKRPWNKGKLIGSKPLLQPKHVWAIRTRLQLDGRLRDLALFNLAVTASSAPATWSGSASRMWLPMDTPPNELPSCRGRPADRFGSRSRSIPETRQQPAFGAVADEESLKVFADAVTPDEGAAGRNVVDDGVGGKQGQRTPDVESVGGSYEGIDALLHVAALLRHR